MRIDKSVLTLNSFAPGGGNPLRRILGESFSRVLHVPLIVPEMIWSERFKPLLAENFFNWIVFSSPHSFHFFHLHLQSSGLDPAAFFSRSSLAAVGAKTAAFVEKRGYSVCCVANRPGAEGLLERLAPLVEPADRILIPQSEIGNKLLAESLSERCAEALSLPVYRTRFASENRSELQNVLRGGVDAVAFTSPSSVSAFLEFGGKPDSRRVNAAIGNTTAATLNEHGFSVDALAAKQNYGGLAAVLIDHFTPARTEAH